MRNRYGMEIRRCCASCKYRKITNDGRMCSKIDYEVASWQYCSQWEMHPKLQNAGEGNGKVKSLDYLNYHREKYLQQREDYYESKILATQIMSTEQIRKEYTEQKGSIYINI